MALGNQQACAAKLCHWGVGQVPGTAACTLQSPLQQRTTRRWSSMSTQPSCRGTRPTCREPAGAHGLPAPIHRPRTLVGFLPGYNVTRGAPSAPVSPPACR
eukprot:364469-Chlamydomonas_euryale.AAC.15